MHLVQHMQGIYITMAEVEAAASVFAYVVQHTLCLCLQSLLRSMTLGAAALAAQAAGSSVPRECCFFASIAPDGKVSVSIGGSSSGSGSSGSGSGGSSTLQHGTSDICACHGSAAFLPALRQMAR
jgi:hypothetical protein